MHEKRAKNYQIFVCPHLTFARMESLMHIKNIYKKNTDDYLHQMLKYFTSIAYLCSDCVLKYDLWHVMCSHCNESVTEMSNG